MNAIPYIGLTILVVWFLLKWCGVLPPHWWSFR